MDVPTAGGGHLDPDSSVATVGEEYVTPPVVNEIFWGDGRDAEFDHNQALALVARGGSAGGDNIRWWLKEAYFDGDVPQFGQKRVGQHISEVMWGVAFRKGVVWYRQGERPWAAP